MNRKISVGMAVTIVILAMTVTFSITMLVAMRLFDSTVNSVKEKESMYNKIAEVDRYVRSNDYYTIDETMLYDRLTAGYLLGTGDKYARYYNATAYTELVNVQNGTILGIGVELPKMDAMILLFTIALVVVGIGSKLIGCGLGASAANREKGVDEYFYLDMLARTGIVGLLLYMLPFGYVVVWCLRRRELLRECPEGAAVVCGLCTFWIVTWFNPWMNAVLGIAWYAVTLSVPTALEERSV